VSELVAFVFSAGGVVSALLGGALWLVMRPRSPQPRRFLLAAAAAYTAASVYIISYGAGWLLTAGLRPLERSDVPPGATAVVVLGSGSFTARDWDERRFSIVDPAAASRVLEAARVFALIDPAWVISSGGIVRPDPDRTQVATAVTMKDALIWLGVPPERIIIETTSRTTHTEAVAVAPLLRSLQVTNTVLVTSATHMRRSLGTFRAAGIEAIPAIARHPRTDLPWDEWLVPSQGGLHEASVVAHEVLGLIYYVARGWYR
jgi:uncharacterized SAM-binding protein YcdF (DUF218 family)